MNEEAALVFGVVLIWFAISGRLIALFDTIKQRK